MSEPFEAIGGKTVYSGHIVDVRIERFRHADGAVVSREVVHHSGAVGMVAHDQQHVWLVRQPREAVGEAAFLEIPAGRLDKQGEEPLAAAQRELAEEIGRGAHNWQPILSFFTGAGFTDEQIHLFLATELYEAHADSGEDERIEIVPWPLEDLHGAIDQCRDAKTLIALFWLAHRLDV